MCLATGLDAFLSSFSIRPEGVFEIGRLVVCLFRRYTLFFFGKSASYTVDDIG